MYNKQFLYKLTFPNGKVYIGCTANIESRWGNGGINYKGQPVYDAIVEYGWNNVKKEVLLQLPPTIENDNKIKKLERELIFAYSGNSYNIVSTEENSNNISNRNIGKRYFGTLWTIDGIEKPAVQWCKDYGISYTCVLSRINRFGFSPKEALMLPKVPPKFSRDAMKYWKSVGAV